MRATPLGDLPLVAAAGLLQLAIGAVRAGVFAAAMEGGQLTGSFVNRNHLAALLCLGALTALGAATEDGLRQIYDGFLAVANCSLPTIAAVNGAAVGAGLTLALAADVRIAGPGAMFDPRFQKLGIHPGGGATWMLQRAVGPQVARASLLFGMRFDAEAAVRYGLALKVAEDPVAAARELAAGPAGAPRDVVIATKASMRATANPGFLDIDQHRIAVDTELKPQAASIVSPEFAKRLAAARRR